MDFESRINQFRQGLKDQQDNYNGLAQSASQYGRSIIPDKVAQHLTYMEQVGGMITGASAGLHGAVEIGKKISKYRQAKKLKNNPTGQKPETQQGDQSSKSAKQGEQQLNEREAQSQADDTKGTDSADQTTVKGKPEAFDEGESGSIKAPKLYDDDDDGGGGGAADDDGGGGGGGGADDRGPAPDTDAPIKGTAVEQETDDSGSTGLGRLFGANKGKNKAQTQIDEDDFEDEGESGSLQVGGGADDRRMLNTSDSTKPPSSSSTTDSTPSSSSSTNTGGNTNPTSDRPTNPSGTSENEAGGDTLSDSEAFSRNLLGDTDNLMPDLGDVADAVRSGASAVGKKIAGGVADAVGEIGGEAVATAVPVLGELFGLGMLIRSVIEHHKHEENAPPPKLTAANPEATEQSGGFSDTMLKGLSSAPSIV